MKIAFFEVPAAEQAFYKEAFSDHDLSFFEEKLHEGNAAKAEDTDVISVFVGSTVNEKVINSLPNVKFITTRSTGFDHIDLEAAKARGIQVSTVPGYGAYTVAEFTFGLMLNLSRKIVTANHAIRESTDFNFYPEMEGFDLRGKTLGVIGTGKIGKNVIMIAKAFGMGVVAHDLHPDMAFAAEHVFSYKSFEEVISQADIITLHVPYTKENHHLINTQVIQKMKKGVYLINTARGELIDTDALIQGLERGIIAGAGLDVLEGERELKEEMEILSSSDKPEHVKDYKTLLEDRALIEMPNVIVTPHIAFYSREAIMEITKITIDNIKGFISGSLINLVK